MHTARQQSQVNGFGTRPDSNAVSSAAVVCELAFEGLTLASEDEPTVIEDLRYGVRKLFPQTLMLRLEVIELNFIVDRAFYIRG